MVRVLIIDNDNARCQTLAEKLTSAGQAVSSMSMINSDNYSVAVENAQIVIALDQEKALVNHLVKLTESQRTMFLLTNTPAKSVASQENIIYFSHSENILEEIDQRVEALAHMLGNLKFMPVAVDARSKALLQMARKAAKSMATVLISGETGVGKEVLAHYIHYHSAFARGPFISVNCAALPDNMMEAILFGYEKGAFTSAINSYIGKFEQAQNGTLLLDEISEISIALQAKLLRVLQEREIERLGGKKPIQINVRIIAATNRDLNQQVVMGAFRKDLFYRLNVIPLICPALRDRPEDILPLAQFMLEQHAALLNRAIPDLTSLAKAKLMNHRWPGNVREMDNVIQRALIMSDESVIDAHDIVLQETLVEVGGQNQVIELEKFSSRLEENEAKVIIDVLKETEGCRNDAAKMLNISPRTLRYKIAKLRSIGMKIP